MATAVNRPAASEYNPYYANYINRVPDGNIFDVLAQQLDLLREQLGGLSDKQANFRYAADQWSIKEVVGHLIDTERVMAYRALCIARNESQPLPGFDQDVYIRESNYSARPFADLLQEFELVRRGNILAFQPLPESTSVRCGNANGSLISVRALIYILAGHVFWHLESLQNEYLEPARRL